SLFYIVAEPVVLRREQDNGRAVLEPSELLALRCVYVAQKYRRPACPGVENDIEKMQADARDQNGGNRYQRNRLPRPANRFDHGALVLAKQPLDPLQSDRIDVPCIAVNEGDAFDMTVMWRVKAVIHAGHQT